MTSFQRKPTIETKTEKDYECSKSVATSPAAVSSTKETTNDKLQSLHRARSNPEESGKFPRKNNAQVVNLGPPLSSAAVQSPKLRNRFALNLNMSSLRKKKQNRRSLPPIEDSPESDSELFLDDPASPPEEKKTTNPPISVTPSSGDSDFVFNSPTYKPVTINAGYRAKSDSSCNASNSNDYRIIHDSDTYLHREDRRRSLLHATSSKSSRFFDDLNPLQSMRSPGALRRGSTPAVIAKNQSGFSRNRSAGIRMKVSVLNILQRVQSSIFMLRQIFLLLIFLFPLKIKMVEFGIC